MKLSNLSRYLGKYNPLRANPQKIAKNLERQDFRVMGYKLKRLPFSTRIEVLKLMSPDLSCRSLQSFTKEDVSRLVTGMITASAPYEAIKILAHLDYGRLGDILSLTREALRPLDRKSRAMLFNALEDQEKTAWIGKDFETVRKLGLKRSELIDEFLAYLKTLAREI